MSTVRGKLNSRRGVTIIMALVFFLTAAIIGSIVITAAYASVGRLTHLREKQQNYLTTSSATKLVRDELKGVVCTFVEVSIDGVDEPRVDSVSPPTGSLSQFAQNVATKDFEKSSISSEVFTVTSEVDVLDTVKAEVVSMTTGTSGTSGTLTIKLSLVDAENPDESPYIMTLSVPFTVSEDTSSVTTTTPNTAPDDEPSNATSTTTVTVTTQYTFQTGTIVKGVPMP